MTRSGLQVYAALEASIGLDAIRGALPPGTPLRAVPLHETLGAGSEIQRSADLVIVGCGHSHEAALEVGTLIEMIERATAE